MIARLTVVRGATTEYPLAERVNGGWQNGVTFYPDADVTEVVELHASRERGQAAEALATLARIRGVDEATNEITLVLEAQVHATLALVEQQRIANLIALVALSGNENVQESNYDEGSTLSSAGMHALIAYERTAGTPISDPDDVPVVRSEIAEALGLS